MKKFFLLLFFIFFSKNYSSNFDLEKIPENEILIVLKILNFGYQRSSKTIIFWENLIKFLEEYKNNTEKLISRMRNPSKFLEDELPLIQVNLNKVFLETKEAYDNYAKTINKYFEPGNLSIYSIEYINSGRHSNKKFKDFFFKNLISDIFSFFDKRFNLKELIFSKLFKRFFTKNESIFDSYVQIDRALNEAFLKNCEININIYINYKNFWKFIEEKRMENLKNHYNLLISYAKKLFYKNLSMEFKENKSFEEKIKLENLPLEIF